MTRHYNTQHFFRCVPKILLLRLLDKYSLSQEIDLETFRRAKQKELFEVWMKLPEAYRGIIESRFIEIFELSCLKGFHAILDEARWQMRFNPDLFNEFVSKLSALPNHYHRAISVYLDHEDCWKGATLFYHADTLSYWRKHKSLCKVQAAVDIISTGQLANLLSNFFHLEKGMGKNCIVETLRRGDLDYYFAYQEDYSQESIEYIGGRFGRRPHNPAFEIVFIYSQNEGSLAINIDADKKVVEKLILMFAQSILKLQELPLIKKNETIYELGPLLEESYKFTWDILSGIQSVGIRKLRLSSRIKKGDRITVEGEVNGEVSSIYGQIEKIGKAIPLHLYDVTQVELVVLMTISPDKPPKTKTIRISSPNSCSLKYDGIDQKLHHMLKASGIELIEVYECLDPEKAEELLEAVA